MAEHSHYYVPPQSHWPIVGCIGLAVTVLGAVNVIHCSSDPACTVAGSIGLYALAAGFLILAGMLFGWFRNVIQESMSGLYSAQMDRSFRWGMAWFIFSEVMFFAAFFGALFYARELSVPWLAGAGSNAMTHSLLWPEFLGVWPLLDNPDPEKFVGARQPMAAWGLPLLNTIILLTSGVTITIAHWGIQKARYWQTVIGLFLTVALGALFLYFQVVEYSEAYAHLDLKLSSGIYGATFFMLTGFHGAHVTIGAIMLAIMLVRAIKGHFTEEHHFAFEAAAWYWHFVDVVWLGLFIFVYCL